MSPAPGRRTEQAQEGAASARRSGMSLSLKGRALRLLAQREHSRAELERKLAAHEEEPGQLSRVLDELQARDFISEARVVDSVVNRRASRFGAARIRHELLGKGLEADAVAQVINALQGSEVERAREVWRKKFGASDPLGQTPAERARQMRFLAARGFGAEAIRRVVSRAGEEADESDEL